MSKKENNKVDYLLYFITYFNSNINSKILTSPIQLYQLKITDLIARQTQWNNFIYNETLPSTGRR